MAVITINSKVVEVEEGMTVLKAALDNGIYIPHFCWHPALSVSGNCRMCAVEIEGRSKLEISCNLPATDGMVVRTDTPKVREMRNSVLEFLLINHPLDCPVCDQAGECLLQDFHFKYSGRPSRFREAKERKPKVVDIGNNVKLDNERCILCTRCVRFCNEVAHSADLTVAARGDRSFITTAPGRRLNNPYSLNTVDICPVGALTSKDFRFKKRVWFLKSTPSVCPFCSNGCPVWLDHDERKVFRMRPRDYGVRPADVKGVAKSQLAGRTFLCDEGRLSYKEWDAGSRILFPLILDEEGHRETGDMDAVTKASDVIRTVRSEDIVAVISAQCSCEEIDLSIAAMREHNVSNIYRTARIPPAASEDGIMIKKDKNPNSRHLDVLGIKPVPDGLYGKVLIVTDSITDDEMLRLTSFKWQMTVQITHSKWRLLPGAHIVLPRAVLPEMEGSFIAYNGEKRTFKKAFEPEGASRPVNVWVERLFSRI